MIIIYQIKSSCSLFHTKFGTLPARVGRLKTPGNITKAVGKSAMFIGDYERYLLGQFSTNLKGYRKIHIFLKFLNF